jgi:hypothetical protein
LSSSPRLGDLARSSFVAATTIAEKTHGERVVKSADPLAEGTNYDFFRRFPPERKGGSRFSSADNFANIKTAFLH